jgi:arylsulfatase
MIITLSDHGELLGEHDMWNHGYGIYPKLVEIPLVIWTKDGTPPEAATDDVVSILDIPQTIAGRTGISFESRGQDLFQHFEPTARLVEYHGFLPWHREQLERKGVGELYNRLQGDLNGIVSESGMYYYETHDDGLCCEEGSVGEGVRARLDDHMGRLSKRSVSQDEIDIPSDVRERLADLGYA